MHKQIFEKYHNIVKINTPKDKCSQIRNILLSKYTKHWEFASSKLLTSGTRYFTIRVEINRFTTRTAGISPVIGTAVDFGRKCRYRESCGPLRTNATRILPEGIGRRGRKLHGTYSWQIRSTGGAIQL